jgi:hypothetical protein
MARRIDDAQPRLAVGRARLQRKFVKFSGGCNGQLCLKAKGKREIQGRDYYPHMLKGLQRNDYRVDLLPGAYFLLVPTECGSLRENSPWERSRSSN